MITESDESELWMIKNDNSINFRNSRKAFYQSRQVCSQEKLLEISLKNATHKQKLFVSNGNIHDNLNSCGCVSQSTVVSHFQTLFFCIK